MGDANNVLMDRYMTVERLVTLAEQSATHTEIHVATDALLPVLTALFMDAQDSRNRKIERLSKKLISRIVALIRPLAEAEALHG